MTSTLDVPRRSTGTGAPAAPTDRWRPNRAGLISIWRYWDETFTFHQGRLLLRGPNGSGKSMALELLLPFLLDGDSSPSRLTSSGRSRGRLFDRLMTGSTDASRTGFAWVEFVQGDDVFTVGARIRGSQSTGRADVDLFTTTLAVGRDLHLLDADRIPLSRKALADALAGTGGVHGSVDEHRDAVRTVLFPGFTRERYTSVIGALLALRREKLSDNLDPAKLSAVLSDALPPLDPSDIAAVAEGFERLDRRRAELAALERDLAEVRQLASRQRSYAGAVVMGAAADVRSAESSRDTVTRDERLATESLAAAEVRLRDVELERTALDERVDTMAVQETALKDSDAYRDGNSLADLRTQARQLRDVADRAELNATRSASRAASAVEERDRAAAAEQLAGRHVRDAEDELRQHARAVGAEAAVTDALALPDPEDAGRHLDAWIGVQRARLGEVRRALDGHRRALDDRTRAEEQRNSADATVAARTAELRIADDAVAAARGRYADQVRVWATTAVTIGSDRVRDVLPIPPDDPGRVTAAVGALRATVQAEQAVARAELARERTTAADELADWQAERERWQGTELVAPARPPWRTERTGLRGAPFWRLLEPGAIDETELGAVESALTASGLIDAWVRPDGRIELAGDRADVELSGRTAVPGPSLADLLRPDVAGTDVDAHIVTAILAAIPVVDSVLGDADPAAGGGVVIGRDGSFRVGPAVGRGAEQPAGLLGAAARERRRLARLTEIDEAISVVTALLGVLDRRRHQIGQLELAVAGEFDAAPDAEEVEAADRTLVAADARLRESQSALEARRSELRAAEEAVRNSLRTLTSLAAGHGLPTVADALDELEDALSRLRDTVRAWVHRRDDADNAAQRRAAAEVRSVESAEDAERIGQEHRDADRAATEAEVRTATLESSVGADYRAVLDRLAELGAERTEARRRLEVLRPAANDLLQRIGALHGEVRAATDRREAAELGRETAHRRFAACLAALGADAGMEPEGELGSATAVLAEARRIGAAREQVDADGTERRSNLVGERLQIARAALGSRVDFDRELAAEGWWSLRVTTGGIHRRIGELAGTVERELADGRAELAEDEERLFEQTLAGSVRRALADRIRAGNALVDGINRQLGAIRTAAAGVAVRLRWDVDPEQPAAVRAARALLLRDPADLSDDERTSLQDFVRARVDQARLDLDAGAPWEARLSESLDYRAWHSFELQIAHRDWDGYQPATTRRLGRLSTGERSMALHLPMIASVAAHYADDAGHPAMCPRLILLDELFAGVDTANRAQLFGAFTSWQLDAVFTSDHEWCQYADLDGIAIHYLSPSGPNEPVTSTRFTWDGVRRLIDPIGN
jgi:uncharacterized protein (TIGR02680 family)